MTQPELFTFISKEIENIIHTTMEPIRFNGSDYSPKHDNVRLTKQIKRVYDLMKDGEWRTLGEIESITGDPQASISAQLRNCKKERFGGHELNKKRRGDPGNGCWEYQLIVKGK